MPVGEGAAKSMDYASTMKLLRSMSHLRPSAEKNRIKELSIIALPQGMLLKQKVGFLHVTDFLKVIP